MKLLIISLLTSLLPLNALAEDYLGGNIQLLLGETEDKNSVTLEYYWSKGKFSGFGHHDEFEDGFYVSEHLVNYDVAPYVYVTARATSTSLGNSQLFGAGFRAGSLPYLNKFFEMLDIIYLPTVVGDNSKQWNAVWATKQWKPFGEAKVGFYLAGFYRDREDDPNFGQPQAWMSLNNGWDIGVEVDHFDGDEAYLINIKRHF